MKNLFITSISAAMILLFLSCTKSIKDEPGKNTVQIQEEKEIKETVSERHKEYLKEGFISGDTYRIVILSTKEECEGESDEIMRKAEKRAETSLQQYLISNDVKVDQNVKADLLSLISKNGEFTKKDEKCADNSVFYFDIKRKNIKSYLDKMGSPR